MTLTLSLMCAAEVDHDGHGVLAVAQEVGILGPGAGGHGVVHLAGVGPGVPGGGGGRGGIAGQALHDGLGGPGAPSGEGAGAQKPAAAPQQGHDQNDNEHQGAFAPAASGGAGVSVPSVAAAITAAAAAAGGPAARAYGAGALALAPLMDAQRVVCDDLLSACGSISFHDSPSFPLVLIVMDMVFACFTVRPGRRGWLPRPPAPSGRALPASRGPG